MFQNNSNNNDKKRKLHAHNMEWPSSAEIKPPTSYVKKSHLREISTGSPAPIRQNKGSMIGNHISS